MLPKIILGEYRGTTRVLSNDAHTLKEDVVKAFFEKISLWNLFAGAVIVSILAFSTGMVTFTSSAESAALAQSEAAVVAALTPVCVSASLADPLNVERMASLKDASTYRRVSELGDYGWANMPGTDKVNRDLATACLAELFSA